MPATVVFDTGSNWLVVTSDRCTLGCDTFAYDHNNSTMSVLHSTKPFEEQYGSADLMGYNYRDLICLFPINGTKEGFPCLDDFDFMAIW